MTQKIESETRRQIASFLPDAIIRALTSYHEFSKSNSEEDECKRFAANHSAAKAAIAHIELLLKLARWADLPDPYAEDHNRQIALSAMIQEAREEVDSHKRKEKGGLEE